MVKLISSKLILTVEVSNLIDRNIKLQRILHQVRELVSVSDIDIIFSKYENIEQFIEEIDKLVHRLEQNDQSVYKDIDFLFAPTGLLQDISIVNGWGEKFIDLSSIVDKLIIIK